MRGASRSRGDVAASSADADADVAVDVRDASGLTEAHLTLALRAGGAGTWRWDRRSGELYWDAALERIYGLDEGSFGGSFDDWVALLHPDHRDDVLAAVDDALERGTGFEVEHRTLRPDGTVAWMHCRGDVLRAEAGEVTGMLGVAVDVTTRQEAEAQRARLLEAERAARARMAFLADASAALSSSLDVEETLAEVAELAVPRLADLCTVELLEQGTLRLVAAAHEDPEKVALVGRLRARHAPSEAHGSLRVVRTGVSEFLPDITDDVLEATARDADHLHVLRQLGPTSVIVVPLAARGAVIGAMQLHFDSGRHHTVDDLTLAEELARHAALAIDNARLFEERSTVARVLQRALLPPSLPQVPGLEVAARYAAAAEGVVVGGDFYDVFEHHSGTWTLLIGDVCGKGPRAAALTALARHTVRAAALRNPDPESLLRVLNAALLQHDPGEQFCTAVCARIECMEEGAELDVVVAGHPPPLLVRAGGGVEQLAPSGTLVGVFEDIQLPRERVTLAAGDAFLGYTDGVTDTRRYDRLFEEEGLLGVLRDHRPSSADELVDAVLAAVQGFDDGRSRRDDVALLAVRAVPGATSPNG